MSESSTETTTDAPKVHRADVPGAKDGDLTVVVLAHPLSNDVDLQTLGLPLGQPVNAGERVAVRPDHARTLIGAGYAQVDSEDTEAVAAALGQTLATGVTPAAEAIGTETPENAERARIAQARTLAESGASIEGGDGGGAQDPATTDADSETANADGPAPGDTTAPPAAVAQESTEPRRTGKRV